LESDKKQSFQPQENYRKIFWIQKFREFLGAKNQRIIPHDKKQDLKASEIQ
jgi:hypothetical protein